LRCNEIVATKQRAIPKAVDDLSAPAGLRAVATFEAVKGLFVLVAGLGLLHYLHKDLGDVAENLVHWLHLNPDRRYSRIFIEAADKLTDGKMWALASGALAYSTVRFVEAYGLWNRRVWAEWFALLSGALYLPWEIFELVERATGLKWAVLCTNVVIVIYMAWVRTRAWRLERE
jgi:uncharacterized membrane protein (DUF2068 family)